MLTVEMAAFSIMHIFAFPYKAYDIKNSSDPGAHYSGGPMGIYALFDAFNPWDIIKATARGFRWLLCGISKRKEDISYKMQADPLAEGKAGRPYDDDMGPSHGSAMPVPGSFHGNPTTDMEMKPPVRRQTED
jgi:hypothetical protein